MSIVEALQWRYATKKFDASRTIPEPLIDDLLTAGNLSATSYGLQPYKFVVVQDKALQAKLVPHSYQQSQVEEASHLIIIAVRTDIDVDYVNDYVSRIESARELPAGSMNGYRDIMAGTVSGISDDDALHWHAKQAYIALGTLLAAAAAMGIDSCPMEGFVPEKYDDILGLTDQKLRSIVVLPVGYRDTDDNSQFYKKVRWPLDKIVVKL